MNFRECFAGIYKSLNPNKHRDMAKLPFFDLVKYFCFLVLFCILISIVPLIPMVSQYDSDLKEELQSFNNFSVDIDADLDRSITLLEKPEVVVNFGKENITNEWILINNESLSYKKFIFFGAEKVEFSEYDNVEENISLYNRIFIFLLPSIIFWVAVLFLAKYAILISLFTILGWLLFISGKNEMTFQNSFKTAIFTATPMTILDLVLWPVAVMYFIPILVYIIYFAIGLIMVSDRKYRKKEIF